MKEAKAINAQELPLSLEILATDRIGRLYNILRKHIEELMEKPFPIEQFRGLITGNTVSCASEGRDRAMDNLAISIADPRYYKCWAGCTREMIREALGRPIPIRTHR